ncbi:hypothetical protein TNCV_4693591 [Trichonephila clavipes]|uniref:Uncharacterized protein n=1 Tax=Trichonephila clavipes TaxID=2585209 RepID=A0A8X7BHJ1_TRICX|nr:hypothetical protein TNCV_4693591 [Trichonephila clavipes]
MALSDSLPQINLGVQKNPGGLHRFGTKNLRKSIRVGAPQSTCLHDGPNRCLPRAHFKDRDGRDTGRETRRIGICSSVLTSIIYQEPNTKRVLSCSVKTIVAGVEPIPICLGGALSYLTRCSIIDWFWNPARRTRSRLEPVTSWRRFKRLFRLDIIPEKNSPPAH